MPRCPTRRSIVGETDTVTEPRRPRQRGLRTVPALVAAAILLAAGILLALAGIRFAVRPASSLASPSAIVAPSRPGATITLIRSV
jgi:hypothetical protein